MNTEDEIRRALRAQYGSDVETVLGVVKEVDETKRTCTISDEAVDMPSVRLQCVTDGVKGLVVFPKAGAQALSTRVEGGDGWMVVACSEIDKIRVDVGKSSIDITDGLIVVNGGTVGMTRTDELTKKINALEQRCNEILAAAQGVIVTLAPSGTFPLAPFFTMPPMEATVQGEIEDTKIKH